MKKRYIPESFILLFVGDELDKVVMKVIAKPFRYSKKTTSPTFRGLIFAITPFSQKNRSKMTTAI